MENEINTNNVVYPNEMPSNEIPTPTPQLVQQPKEKIGKAVLFGLLSVIVTPILAWVLFPFIGSGEISILGIISGIGAGPLLAPFFLISVVVTGLVAQIVLKSKRLTLITFCSACVIQIALFAWLAYIGLKVINFNAHTATASATDSNNPDTVVCQGECIYTQYVKIGVPSVAFKEPFDFSYAINGKMDTAQVYKRAEVNIPLTVQHNGNYEIIADYGDSSQTKNEHLETGERVLRFEFVHGNYDKYGWLDKEKDILRIRLSYLATNDELIAQMNQETAEQNPAMQELARKAQEQFFKDFKNLPATVRKFVTDKEIKL